MCTHSLVSFFGGGSYFVFLILGGFAVGFGFCLFFEEELKDVYVGRERGSGRTWRGKEYDQNTFKFKIVLNNKREKRVELML